MQKPLIGVTTSFEDAAHLENQNVNPYYLEAIEKAGGEPKVLNFLTPIEELPEILKTLQGLLLIGGGDVEPELYGKTRAIECGPSCLVKDQYEIAITQLARKIGMPILGICRGAQVVNAAFGGTLHQHVPNVTGKLHQQKPGNTFWHDVNVVENTLLHSLVGKTVLTTNSYHHQAADRVPDTLTVSAMSNDGIVEALEGKENTPFLLALQWHPERTVGKDTPSLKYFQAFVQAAANYHPTHK